MIKLLYKVLPCKYNATLGDHLLHNLNRTCLVRLEKRSFQNSSCMWINRDMAATSPSPSSGTTSPNPAPSSSSTDAPKNFYRRVLPETCIAFGSNEGKEVFKEALIKGIESTKLFFINCFNWTFVFQLIIYCFTLVLKGKQWNHNKFPFIFKATWNATLDLLPNSAPKTSRLIVVCPLLWWYWML